MLGNFSFGDYFKREAIRFAWEFCTSPQWMGLPKDRMFPTIYGPTPDKIDTRRRSTTRGDGLPEPADPARREGELLGPRGRHRSVRPLQRDQVLHGHDEELKPDPGRPEERRRWALRRLGQRVIDEGDLFLEIWNMVFPQFDQQRDGSRPLLKNKGIDTGAGLERMTVALNFARTGQLTTPYETDLMSPISMAVASTVIADSEARKQYSVSEQASRGNLAFNAIKAKIQMESPEQAVRIEALFPRWTELAKFAEESATLARQARMHGAGITPGIARMILDWQLDQNLYRLNRLKVNAIADHTRTLVFCLAEGLTPGNVGRRYVIRRIQRRALRFASLLGVDKPFMADLYDGVVEAMGDAYPEIKQNPEFIRKALRIEEETFLRTRDRGTKILDELMAQARERGDNRIPGHEAFRLWDTYGFPIDLTSEIAEDAGISVDMDGYTAATKSQKEEAKKSWKGAKLDFNEELLDEVYETHGATEFTGYEGTGPAESEITALIHTGSTRDNIQTGEEGLLVLLSTPFYAEGGGQTGDIGVIENGEGRFVVTDCIKSPQGLFIHKGRVEHGVLKVGEKVTATVDAARRASIRRNHSSVHLLQNALKRLVGAHITQAGSFVGPDYSRFDFTHTEGISREQLVAIQREVNRLILENTNVQTDVLSLEEAKQRGAIAPFGEKYGAVVRVVQMGPSMEFCGGTHVATTGEIAHYRIVSEASIASGVRRIEAITGAAALEAELTDQYQVVDPLQKLLAAKGPETLTRIDALQNRVKDLEKEVARLRRDAALKDLDAHAKQAKDVPNGRLCVVRVDDMDGNELRVLATALRDKLGDHAVAVVLSVAGDKVGIVAAVGKQAQLAYPAGTVVNRLAAELGGKGGGKPDLAQAGAKDIAKVDEVIAKAEDLIVDYP
jgi:alanine--tRNA ligase